MEEGWESDGAVIDGDEKSNKVEGRAFLLRFTPFECRQRLAPELDAKIRLLKEGFLFHLLPIVRPTATINQHHAYNPHAAPLCSPYSPPVLHLSHHQRYTHSSPYSSSSILLLHQTVPLIALSS